MSSSFRRRLFLVLLLLALWLLLIGVAACFDARVACWVYSSQTYLAVKHARWMPIAKFPGNFRFTLAVAAVLTLGQHWEGWRQIKGAVAGMLSFRRPRKWQAGGFLCLCGMMAGLLYTVAKWVVGRYRPISMDQGIGTLSAGPFVLHPFNKGLLGLFISERDQSFPSGHACLSFAMAAALGIWFPKWRVPLFIGACGMGVQRVLEGAHYPSDVVAGAGFGVLATALTWWLCSLVLSHDRSALPVPGDSGLQRTGEYPHSSATGGSGAEADRKAF